MTTMHYFEIRAPRADFTGRIGGLSFADGIARVQFDDERDDRGLAVSEEHQVNPGRSLVLFAQRRKGYTVVELGADGKPLSDGETAESGRLDMPAANGSTASWRAYAIQEGLDPAEAEKLDRPKLVERYGKETNR